MRESPVNVRPGRNPPKLANLMFLSPSQRRPLFIKRHCARPCAKSLACVISFNPRTSPISRHDDSCPHFTDEGTEARGQTPSNSHSVEAEVLLMDPGVRTGPCGAEIAHRSGETWPLGAPPCW